jgi:microcystin-dependent protein
MQPSPSEAGPQFLIVGGQDVFVTLTSTGVQYVSRNERFRADVTVTNRIVQTMGTLDGVTPDSVKVFFHTGPVVSQGTGTVTVANPDGLGAFTGTDQPYFGYAGLIDHLGVSEKRVWQWNVPTTVLRFDFSVYVAAAVQYPDGWVEVTPATASISVGGSEPLAAVAYDVVGRTGGTVTWSSSNPAIASVDPETGVVTGVAEGGPVTITASTGGPEADGTAEITVTAP